MNKYDFGTQFQTKSNGECTVICYVNATNVCVMFRDGTIVKCRAGNLTNGVVKNPNNPSVFGAGINDFKMDDCCTDKRYTLWHSMLRRCYSADYQKGKPTYIGVKVDKRWLRLSNFVKDIEEMPFFAKSITEGYELDKDLLGDGSKIYSVGTCCFIPRELNAFFTRGSSSNGLPTGVLYNKRLGKYVASLGTDGGYSKHLGVFDTLNDASKCYVVAKKTKLLDLAEKYKGRIEDRVYDKLINFDFSIEY